MYQGDGQSEFESNMADSDTATVEESAANVNTLNANQIDFVEVDYVDVAKKHEDSAAVVPSTDYLYTYPGDEAASRKPIRFNETSKEVVVDLATFLNDVSVRSSAGTPSRDYYGETGAKHAGQPRGGSIDDPCDRTLQQSLLSVALLDDELDDKLAKTLQMRTLIMEADRIIHKEEYRDGGSESEQTDWHSPPLHKSFDEYVTSISKRGDKTIRLIVAENVSQEQFKVQIRMEKNHLKIMAINLNHLQGNLRGKMSQAGRTLTIDHSQDSLGDGDDVQVFQKLEYDKQLVQYLKHSLKSMDDAQLQQFFNGSLKVTSTTDGQIVDVSIKDHIHEEENSFMEQVVIVEGQRTLRHAQSISVLKIFETEEELAEVRHRKAHADYMFRMMICQSKITSAMRSHVARKKWRERERAIEAQEVYVQRAEEQQMMQSSSSRDGDPALPESPADAARTVSRQGLFLSQANRNYVFLYKVHSDHNEIHNASALDGGAKQRSFCWSMYVKIRGSRIVTVWQYHRFAKDILEQVEENQKIKGDDPADLLKLFLERIGKQTADLVLEEAEDEKIDFSREALADSL